MFSFAFARALEVGLFCLFVLLLRLLVLLLLFGVLQLGLFLDCFEERRRVVV
jgi:hypothetical protein